MSCYCHYSHCYLLNSSLFYALISCQPFLNRYCLSRTLLIIRSYWVSFLSLTSPLRDSGHSFVASFITYSFPLHYHFVRFRWFIHNAWSSIVVQLLVLILDPHLLVHKCTTNNKLSYNDTCCLILGLDNVTAKSDAAISTHSNHPCRNLYSTPPHCSQELTRVWINWFGPASTNLCADLSDH